MANRTTLVSLIDKGLNIASKFSYDSEEMDAELNKVYDYALAYKELVGENYKSRNELVNRYDLEIDYCNN